MPPSVSPPYGVRPVEPEDAGPLGEAHGEAWRVGYASLYDADFLASAVATRKAQWHDILRSRSFAGEFFLVAEHAGSGVVGFLHGLPDADSEHHDGEILGFYVHPHHWGTGASSALMTAGLVALGDVGLSALHLWTHAGAARAHAFYARAGWTRTGRTDGRDFGDGRLSPLIELETSRVPAPGLRR